jgi:HAD superfamily hydrolase (TIGR01490 family)
MTLAIFDLDNTLLRGDSDHAWGEFLVGKGLVNSKVYRERNDYFYQQYQLGKLDVVAYQTFVLAEIKSRSPEEIFGLRAQFMAEVIEPMVLSQAEALVNHHRDQGHTLMIITATNDFITRPIATRFGIEHLIATEAELKDGLYTGNIVGTPSYQGGKIERLNDWLKTRDHSLAGAWFYSDSHNDLPLLKCVDNPVAVDPDDQLKQFATQQQWPIMSLR